MRARTPQHALLTLILRAAASPAGHNVQCPTCGEYYESCDTAASHPHNNH